jgi:hypothetical protein
MMQRDRIPTLCDADQRLVDALVDAGFEPSRLGPLSDDDRRRVDAIMRMMGLLDDYPVDDADMALIDATLARIDSFERSQSDRMQLGGEDGSRWRVRLSDFISVAAVILILVSVTVPVVNSVRTSSLQASCANNMRLLASSFGTYANDHNGAMPMAAGFPGATELGKIRTRPWGADPNTVVVADLNPVLTALLDGRPVENVTISSPTHRGVGQNLLFSDGSVRWQTSPMIGNDNIWLPRLDDGTEQLSGRAVAPRTGDNFLVQ